MGELLPKNRPGIFFLGKVRSISHYKNGAEYEYFLLTRFCCCCAIILFSEVVQWPFSRLKSLKNVSENVPRFFFVRLSEIDSLLYRELFIYKSASYSFPEGHLL